MVLAREFVCNPFCVYLLPLENSEARGLITQLKQVTPPDEALRIAGELEEETRYLAGKVERTNEE